MNQQHESILKTVKNAALKKIKEIQQAMVDGKDYDATLLPKLSKQVIDADSDLESLRQLSAESKSREDQKPIEAVWPDVNLPATQANLARLIGVARSTVHGHHENNLFKEGALLGDWLSSYITKIRDEAAGRSGEASAEIGNARLAETKIKTKKLQLEFDQLEGKLIDEAYFIELMKPAFSHIETTLESAANKIVQEISIQHGVKVDKRIIDDELSSALLLISEYTSDDRKSTE